MLVGFACGFVKVRRRVFLHLDGAQKENVILQVNVLMQIGLYRGQSLVERLKTDTALGRRRERLGRWVGPIGGALCSFLAAFCVARPLTSGRKTNVVAVGFFLAVLDVVLLVASQAPFQWLFVVSNLGKVLAGYIGGVTSFRFGKDTQKPA